MNEGDPDETAPEQDPPSSARVRYSSLDDDLFRALADAHRRRTLAILRSSSPVAFDELVDVLTGWEGVTEGGGVGTREDRQVVAAELHHVHLPRLEAAGLVTYDQSGREVALADVDPGPVALLDFLFEGLDEGNP